MKALLKSHKMILWFLSLGLLIWSILLIDLHMVSQIYIYQAHIIMIYDFLNRALDFCWEFMHLFQQEDWCVIFFLFCFVWF